FKV
ncbi:hypothetical protein S40288_11734, partial [Stachybotrys chartarum IBT 40288]